MADGNHRPHFRQSRDLAGLHRLGCQGQHHRHTGIAQAAHHGDGALVQWPDECGRMGATAGHADMRPLDMQPDEAGQTLGGNRGIGGLIQLVRCVGDKGGQQGHGAKPAVGGGDCLHGGKGWVVVQQHIAAAIDLQIDIAGG